MSKNIVFIPSIIDERRLSRSSYNQFSIDSWKIWCDKNDCELFILDQLLVPMEEMKITWQRYYLFDILDANDIDYEQVLMVDADTIVHPDCPNFFNIVNYRYGVVRNVGSMDWICRSIENYSKYIFDGNIIPFHNYFNGGFQVVNKKHKPIFSQMLSLYNTKKEHLLAVQKEFGTGTDQTPINYLLHQNEVDVCYLPFEYNMCDMPRVEILTPDLLFIKIGWIYHFCAIPGGDSVTHQWMEKTYNELYMTKN